MTSSLERLASTESGVERPRDFHVPFVTRTDHRDGTRRYVGQGAGLVVEEWNDVSGIRLMKLGVEVKDLVVTGDRDVAAWVTGGHDHDADRERRRSPRSNGRAGSRCGRRVAPADSGASAGRNNTETRRDAPGGATHPRPRRPRPAVWKSATATRPSGAPRRASSSR